MDYVRLGKSGLEVSRIVLGCMSFGDPARGHHAWALGLDEARPLIRQALDAGITTFDTANTYSLGASEEIVGTVIAEAGVRDEVLVATKVFGRMSRGPKGGGLSRAAIVAQVDASLRRLGTDYIDLYQIHRLDPAVPIEEVLAALHDLVREGKVRYVGASSMAAWQFVQAQYVADLHGCTRFVSMQDQYNLLMREEEREMHPFCIDQGIGVLPWSPLARGRLARLPEATTARSQTDAFADSLYRQNKDASARIMDVVAAVATEHGVTRAQIALAWLLAQPAVTAPIVGITRPEQLTDAVAALDVRLNDDELNRLGEHYRPQHPEAYDGDGARWRGAIAR